jgi:hypothetical protein
MTTLEPTRNESQPLVVRDPHLSEAANAAVTRDLRAAVGADAADAPVPDAELHNRRRSSSGLAGDRLLLLIALATALTTGAVVLLAGASWWWIAVPLGVHLAATIATVATAMTLAGQGERPAPETAALLEEQGVGDPDRTFNELVRDLRNAG